MMLRGGIPSQGPKPSRGARLANERGQAIVEFAIIVPILLLVVWAIFQFGRVYAHWIALNDAVRAAARAEAVCRFGGDPNAAFAKAASDLPDYTPPSIDAPNGCTAGSSATVSATYPFEIGIPGTGFSLKTGNLTSQLTERIE